MALLFLWIVYLVVAAAVLATARSIGHCVPAACAVAFLLLPVLFCLPGFFRGRTILPTDQLSHFPPWSAGVSPAPHNPYLNDAATQLAPWAKAVRMAWKEGSLPLRNRWNGAGMALAANGQSAAFSPFTFAMVPLPLAYGFTLVAAGKLFLALTGMWLWLRALEVSATSALLGAIAFAFSMTMTPWLLFPNSAVFCLWPWALFAIERILSSSGSRAGFVLLVAVFSAWILDGHPESACLGGFGIGLFLLGRLVARDPTLHLRRLLPVAAAVLLAVALTAFLWLPELLAIRASSRYATASEFRSGLRGHSPHLPGWSLGFLTSVFPRALGDDIGAPHAPQAPFSFPDMALGYFGAAGWALGLLILRPGPRPERRDIALLFPLLCGLAIGTATWPIFEGYLSVPLLNLLLPPRFLSWVSLFGSALAAFEVDRLTRDAKSSRRSRGLALLAPALLGAAILAAFLRLRPFHSASGGLAVVRADAGVALAALAGVATLLCWICLRPKRAAPAGILLAAVAFGELLYQGAQWYRWGDPPGLFPPTPLVRFLQAQSGVFRVLGVDSALFPSTNVFAGVEEIRTHDAVERRDYVDFLDRTCGYDPKPYFKKIRDLEAPALDFLNVRFLVSGDPAHPEDPRWRRVYSGPDGAVLENTHVLPRVFSPRRIRVLSQSEAKSMPLPQDWAQEATIVQTRRISSGVELNPPVDVSDYVETTNRVRFRVRSLEPGRLSILVTSLVDDGGWTVRDGRGRLMETLRANSVFLGLVAEAGAQEIRLDYAPRGFRAGALLSAATVVLLLLFWVSRSPMARFR